MATLRQALADWRDRLESLAGQLDALRQRVDDERRQAATLPLRRMLPWPGDPVETSLYERFAGTSGRSSPLPSRVFQRYREGLSWRPGARPLTITLRLREPGTDDRRDDDEPMPLTVDALDRLLAPLFTDVRQVSVFEALELAGQDADALVRELRWRSAPLAATRTPSQLKQTPSGVPYQDWRLVFADWRVEGPGSRLSRQVQAKLTAEQATTGHTGAAERSVLPAGDRVLAFTARHLIDLAAFRGVEVLNDAYHRRRLQTPSPHVFAEEKAAAKLEARSEDLADLGLLPAPLRRVEATEVDLCTDDLLLKYSAAALAAGYLRWEETDLVRNEGWWVVRLGESEARIGTDRDLGVMLRLIAKDRQQRAQSRDRRAAIEEAGRAALDREDAGRLLEAYARTALSEDGGVRRRVEGLLRVAAAELAAQLRSRNLRSIAS